MLGCRGKALSPPPLGVLSDTGPSRTENGWSGEKNLPPRNAGLAFSIPLVLSFPGWFGLGFVLLGTLWVRFLLFPPVFEQPSSGFIWVF